MPIPDMFEEAPRLVKDMLRGLRHELKQFDPTRDLETLSRDVGHTPFPLGLSPLALAAELVRETRKAAKFGSALARDVIDPQTDEALMALADGREADRASYVQARYQATRYLMKRMGFGDHLLLERPIARVWSETASSPSSSQADAYFTKLADQALRLAASGAIAESGDQALPFRIFAALSLTEAMLALSPPSDTAAVIGALELAAEIVTLRQGVFDAIMNGFDPLTALSAELKRLAPHLVES
ncbi:MAG: hypothetical protein KGO21_01430 [Hyphomicrobiales bacterium]|nr:hypothetical protein [Hyphomicrobiales bacterium]